MSDKAGRPVSLRIPLWLFRVVLVCLALCVLFFIFGAFTYTRLLAKASSVDDLQIENQILRDYTERVHSLESDLKTNRMLLRRMMELAGIDDVQYGSDSGTAGAAFEETAPLVTSSQIYNEAAPASDTVNRSVPNGTPMLGTFSRGFAATASAGIRRHLGLDIAAKEGTPVYATADGKVEFASWDETFGNYLVIDHLSGYKTCFGHNRAILVSVGDNVKKGELISLSGNTGKSSAPHLHYEIRLSGEPVDPTNFMDIKELKQAE
jgi:murein DD-endopeptidase MepM/ murein hydrolase activator NlpD